MDDFAAGTIRRTTLITRQALSKLSRKVRTADDGNRDDALDYNDGIMRSLLRTKIKQRFGQELQIVDNTTGDTGGSYETIARPADIAAIDNDFYETITSNSLARIIRTLSTLFNQPTQDWQYVVGSGKEQAPAEDVAERIAKNRTAGKAQKALIRTDKIANLLQVGVMRLGWRANHLTYHAVPPQCVYLGFGLTVIDDDKPVSADLTDIEDASIVAFKVASGSNEVKDTFYAYIGRSSDWPDGRAVQYRAKAWDDILSMKPDDHNPDILNEWKAEDGTIANPLTYAQNQLDVGIEKVPYEYPVIFFQGEDITQETMLPKTEQGLDLYWNIEECDVMLSSLMKSARISAQGLNVISNPDGDPLPKIIEGTIVLNGTQTFAQYNIAASNSKDAMEVYVKEIRSISEGRGVPGHLVVADDATDESSGRALIVRYLPLLEVREDRKQANTAAVDRLFWIEMSLSSAHTGEWDWPTDIQQIWDAGHMELPLNPVELLAQLETEKKLGLINKIGLTKKYRSVTDAEAIAILRALKEQDENEEVADLLDEPAAPAPAGFGGIQDKILANRAGRQQPKKEGE